MRLFLFVLLAGVWLCGAATSPALEAVPPAKCPLTQVDQYQYYCDISGWVQNPYNLTGVEKAQTLDKCTTMCKAKKACKSYRYVQKTKDCQLYSQYLYDMALDQTITKPGVLNDRDCYTTDCNVIDACQVVEGSCDDYHYYNFVEGPSGDWDRYACTYGYTAKILGYKYKDYLFKYDNDVCGAVRGCVDLLFEAHYRHPGKEPGGTFDLHHHIPSQQWVCRIFEDATSNDYTYRQEDATHRRYTQRNSSVGAGYGYWRVDISIS